MNALTIGSNIKKLRSERNVTQQQLADALSLSFQAVSKWETGTSAPDVATLPEIAGYFNTTIDELFKSDMTVYKNKAERLMTAYECGTDDSEAFERADAEYKRLFASDRFDTDDLSGYAYLNDCRARYYIRVAERYYRDAIARGAQTKDAAYYKNQRQYILFLSRLGRSAESIAQYAEILGREPDCPSNYASLAAAHQCAGDYESALRIAEKGLALFPEDAMLLLFAGDACKGLGLFDRAAACWEKSFELDPEMVDTRYSLAESLTQRGRTEEAMAAWEQIVAWNEKRGFDLENKRPKAELRKLRGETG